MCTENKGGGLSEEEVVGVGGGVGGVAVRVFEGGGGVRLNVSFGPEVPSETPSKNFEESFQTREHEPVVQRPELFNGSGSQCVAAKIVICSKK